jgi:DNA topoisomerase-1
MVLYAAEKDEEEKKSHSLPPLKKGDNLKLLGLSPEQHFTQPPPRFSEATLIKMLEQWDIGRPSTYAPILSTIQGREYVAKDSGKLKPTELGSVVNDILVKHFPDIVDIEFTAHMENELDKIAHENTDWVGVVRDFYTPFAQDLEKAAQLMEKVTLAEEMTEELCPKCDKPMVVKSGRFGKFLACSGYPECKHTTSFRVNTGVRCPKCGSEIVEKLTKKKRIFYGCSNYPNCQFAINLKPLPQPCPECGGLLTMYRRKWTKCSKCGYRGNLQQE